MQCRGLGFHHGQLLRGKERQQPHDLVVGARRGELARRVPCHTVDRPKVVLDTLVQKTEQIKQELGCLPPVVISKLSALLKKGINPTALQQTMAEIDGVDQDEAYKRTQSLLNEELEESRQQSTPAVPTYSEAQLGARPRRQIIAKGTFHL